MIFTETKLKGSYIIDIMPYKDERGFFARAWCQKEFAKHGLIPHVAQANLSFNHKKGTLRGMHYQLAPYAESKLVRCSQGAIYDVIIDLRRDSPTYKEWVGVELSAQNRKMLYVPEGFAHGFQTLTDNSEVTYQVTQFYMPGFEQGARHNDPAFGIEWPLEVSVISPKDKNWANYEK